MRIWCKCLSAICFGLACLFALPAHARDLVPIDIGPVEPLSAYVVPQSIPIYLHKGVPPLTNVDVVQLRRAITRHIQNHPYLRLLDDSVTEEAIRNADLAQADAAMQAEIDMGYAQAFMADANYASAIVLLTRVVSNYGISLTEFVHPKLVAQANQMLAYAYIEQSLDDPELAHEHDQKIRLAFVEMVRNAPYLMLLEGRQSPERVRFYNEARELFLGNAVYRRTPETQAAALSHMIGADILLFPRIVQKKTGDLDFEMDIYNGATHAMTYLSQALDLPGRASSDAECVDMATRMLSGYADCLAFEPPVLPGPQQESFAKRVYIDIGPSYATFLVHPTIDMLHGVGGFVTVAYMFDEHFYVRVGGEIVSIFGDRSKELNEHFQVYHFPVMFGISRNFRWVRPYLGLGLDFGFSTTYTLARSTICKTFGTNDRECAESSVVRNRDPYGMYVVFNPGVNFGRGPFFVTLEWLMNVTVYLNESEMFKHLMGGRIAFQYWF